MLTTLPARAAGLREHPRRAIAVGGVALIGLWFVANTYQQAGSATAFVQFTIIGLSIGCAYAVVATGLVITYTTTGVFNFAHGAVGMICAFTYQALWVDVGIPSPLALLLVVGGLAPAIGLLFERIMRSFRNAPPGTSLTVTIALTVLLIGVAQSLFQSDGGQRTLPRLFGPRNLDMFEIRVPWDRVATLLVAVAVAVLLRLLLFRSRTGVAMRAVVDNPDLASLNGARPVALARYSWMLGSVLAATGGVLVAPFTGALDAIVLTFVVLSSTAYGAAVFGRLRSLPLTVAGALLLGLLTSYSPVGFPDGELWSHLRVALPGAFLFLALLALPEAKLAVGRIVTRSTPAVPGLASSVARSGLFLPAAFLTTIVMGSHLADLTQGFIFATLLLSLVVLTGMSGQISLAQYVFFGLGAFAMSQVAGGSSLLGLAAAAAIAVPAGIITALPALRLGGLYLALATFAVAIVSRELVFQDSRVYGSANVLVGRPEIFGVSFEGNRAFSMLCAATFTVVAIGVLALRRGPYGRRLAALRDSRAACATLGMDVRRTKLTVFALSAAIAGLAGALQGGLAGTAGALDFEPISNVILLLYAFVGGITTVTGALVGGMLFAMLPVVQSQAPAWAGGLLFAGVALAAIALGKQPHGLAGLLYGWLGRGRQLDRPSPTPASRPAGSTAPEGTSDDTEEVVVGVRT